MQSRFLFLLTLFFSFVAPWGAVAQTTPLNTPAQVPDMTNKTGKSQDSTGQSSLDSAGNTKKKKQKTPDDVLVVAFDEGGRIIQYLPQVIHRNQKIMFKVRVSRTSFERQINQLFLRIDSVYAYFKGRQENQFVLWALFKSDTVESWLKDLGLYQGLRQRLKENFYSLAAYEPTTENELYESINAIRYFPIKTYLYKLLFEHFAIYRYDVSQALRQKIPVTPDFSLEKPDKNDCYWWYSEVFLLDSLMGKNCGDCERQLNFSLIVGDPWGATLNEWYNVHFAKADSLLKGQKQELKDVLNYLVKNREQVVKIEVPEVDTSVFYREIRKAVHNKTETIRTIDSLFVQFASNSKAGEKFSIADYLLRLRTSPYWFFHWLWYNYQWLVIDPVPVASPPNLVINKERLKESQRALQRFLEERRFLDSVKAHVPATLQKLSDFQSAQDASGIVDKKIDSTTKDIANLTKQVKADSVADAKAKAAAQAAQVTARRAYAGVMPVLGGTKWYQQRFLNTGPQTILKQFNYSDRLGTIRPIYGSERKRNQVTELPDNERALLVLHNIPMNSNVSVEQKLTGYNDLEEFTSLFQRLLKNIDSTGLFGAALAPNVSNLSTSLMKMFSRPSTNQATEDAAKRVGIAYGKDDRIDAFSFAYLQRSLRNDPFPISQPATIVTQLGSDIDTTGGYLTKLVPTVDSTAPFQVNLTLGVDSIKTKSVIQTGALHRFQLLAGFAVVNNPVQQTSIDTTGSDLRTGSESNNTSIIVGFKIYPAKAFLRDGSLWPRYPLRRFSLVAAVSVPKPLNNFYLGGGYDLVPGLCFTMGANIYRQNYYQVQNGRITNSATRYASGGVYYGVALNPVLFVQFIKLFFN